MNPENRAFSNHEEEKSENKAENKENKEFINLSFASAANLVKQIEEKGFYKLNEYQSSCQFAVVHNKRTEKYDFWDFGDEFYWNNFRELDPQHKEEIKKESERMKNELPNYFNEVNDKNMKVFFCGSEYDIPLRNKIVHTVLEDVETNDNIRHFLTPDGIHYEYIKTFVEAIKGRIIYFDQKQLSINEIKEICDKDELFVGERFVKFDYDQSLSE